MSRTKHTDPERVRAARRVLAPRDGRGVGDLSGERTTRRLLKTLGIGPVDLTRRPDGHYPLPRIRTTRPSPGFQHPAGRSAIRRILAFFGPVSTYGIRSIELRQRPSDAGSGVLIAELRVPGAVVLFEQPPSPWLLTGDLDSASIERLTAAGAVVEAETTMTTVRWPGETLANFMLFEGLMHEIGHHIVQQYRGKRTAPQLRTKDHERRAAAFGDLCRRLWVESGNRLE